MTEHSKKRSPVLVVGLIVIGLLIAAFVLFPNMMRMRMASKLADPLTADMSLYLGSAGGAAGEEASELPDRKVIRTASLRVLVEDVPKSATQIETLVRTYGGYVEKTEISQAKSTPQRAEIVVRVPATRLDEARVAIKRLARLVESDKTEAHDVTKEFIDSEARLRNFQAEERQYLEIMRRATKVEDTLNVAKELSDVRGRIEQLQAQIKYLSQQVEMASISVSLRVESAGQSSQWRPWYQTKLAFADMVEGLINFADSIIYILLMLPVVLLWIVTIIAAALAVFKLFLWAKRRFPQLSKPLGERSQS